MANPAVVFADPLLAALTVLRAEAPAHVPGVTFGTVTPSPSSATDSAPPYVRLALDAAFGRYPVALTATLRLVAYAATEAQALALAQVCRAVLLSHPGDASVRSFGELTGPIPTTDPDSGSPVAFVTVSARVRPTSL